MKKIINSILAFVTLFSVTSCDLDMDPETVIRPEDAYTMEYCEGVRGYVYVDLKALLSGDFYSIPDLYVDVLNVCIGSGNQGIYSFNWRLYPTDQGVTSFWSSYYTTMMHINYAIRHMDAAYEYLTPDEQKKVDVYKGEMYFFRAYVMHRAALLFCEDYDPDKAADQLGLPYPKEWEPEAKLARGTLAKLYENVEADLVEAEKTVTAQGTPTDQIYLTKDAITAFRAELALHLHQYTEASQYAQSLYGTYPLVTTAEGLERMWREDTSTENILQLEVLRTTMTTVNSFGSYLNSSWEPNLGEYFYAPTYIPEQHIVKLFKDADFRTDIFLVKNANVTISGNKGVGVLIGKFRGNKNFQTNTTTLVYRNRPKMFRISQMYLVDAEAQYRLDPSKGLDPLNQLRTARGLAALAMSDVEKDVTLLDGTKISGLFNAIQEERGREMLAEGTRLYDLKRWGQGFQRNVNTSLAPLVDNVSYLQTMKQTASSPKFVWPIPNSEMTQNPNFGSQNQGYL